MKSYMRMFMFAAIFALMIFWIIPGEDENTTDLADVFLFDATYDGRFGAVTITFTDKTAKTTATTLEILGLSQSYHRTFAGPSFIETVQLGDPPGLGWAAHPVTISAEHPEFGTVMLKTEIHTSDQEAPDVIIGRP